MDEFLFLTEIWYCIFIFLSAAQVKQALRDTEPISVSSESIPKCAFIARSECRVYRIQPRLHNSNQSTKESSAQQFPVAYRTFFHHLCSAACCEISSVTPPCWLLPQAGRERDPHHLLHELASLLRKQTFRGKKKKNKGKKKEYLTQWLLSLLWQSLHCLASGEFMGCADINANFGVCIHCKYLDKRPLSLPSSTWSDIVTSL